MTRIVPRSLALVSALLAAACTTSGSYRVNDTPRTTGPAPTTVEVTLGTYGVPLNDDGDVLTTTSSLTTDGGSASVVLHYADGRTVPAAAMILVKDADADIAVLRPRGVAPAPRAILADMVQLRPGDGLYSFGRDTDQAKGLCSKARAGAVIKPYPDVPGPGYLNGTLIARIDWADEATKASQVPMPCPIMAGEGVLNEDGQLVGMVTKYRVSRDGIKDGIIVIPADRIARFLYQHRIAYTVIVAPPNQR